MMVLPPNTQVPRATHSQTPAHWATGSTTSKLRDSCQGCALSKVKCHKEKPTCSRCAGRDIKCEYFVTKRPGRKRDNSRSTNNDSYGDTINVVTQDFSGRQSTWAGSTASSTHTTLSGSSDYLTTTSALSPTSPRPGNVPGAECFPSDIFSGLLIPLEPDLPSTLTGMSSEYDEFYTSPIDFFELDAREPINFTSDIAKLLMPDDIDLDPFSDTSSFGRPHASKPSSPSSNGLSLSTSYTSVTSALDSTCGCLMQALECMKIFSSTKPPACVLSNSLDSAATASNLGHSGHPSAQAVVLENKKTIEAVSNMLHCSCAEDAYLLTMLSMIIFKILGRYAVAARKQPGEATERREKASRNASSKEQVRLLSSYCPDDEDLGRIAAQLILSELHRVQRLVNQLSPRLKTRGLGASGKAGGISGVKDAGGDSQMSSPSDDEMTAAPFSATTLDQIEIDLRKCLSTLSSEIISMLQNS